MPSRPYKCLKDILVDPEKDFQDSKMYTMECTINLFDVDNFCEVNNDLEGFKDDIKRTLVYLPEGRCWIIRVSYREFNDMILQIKKDYQLLDDRSMTPPDKIAYKGPIQTSGATTKAFMAVTFHRKGYEPKSYEDFAYHTIFHNIYPMN